MGDSAGSAQRTESSVEWVVASGFHGALLFLPWVIKRWERAWRDARSSGIIIGGGFFGAADEREVRWCVH